MNKESFGGHWTTSKLECLRKYLNAHTTIMRKQNFNDYMYIDAFAGTGWLYLKQDEEKAKCQTDEKRDSSQLSLFSEFNKISNQNSPHILEEPKPLDGSARIALKIQPTFIKYIFIEKHKKRFRELQKLKVDFSEKEIVFENSDANAYIKNLCQESNWIKEGRRAVLFLDPYGMQVPWDTVEIIANTKAIDLWYLFPIGVALNRLLKNKGNICESNRNKIDMVLGTSDWHDIFYRVKPELFNAKSTEKIADINLISQYIISRFCSIFEGVANNPRILLNSQNSPLYLLCFASANPKGSNTAIKIAQNILKRN